MADSEAIAELWREGCTLQVVQPQRWEGRLLRLVAALEGHLGCLVGANAYLTPPSTQGGCTHLDRQPANPSIPLYVIWLLPV